MGFLLCEKERGRKDSRGGGKAESASGQLEQVSDGFELEHDSAPLCDKNGRFDLFHCHLHIVHTAASPRARVPYLRTHRWDESHSEDRFKCPSLRVDCDFSNFT